MGILHAGKTLFLPCALLHFSVSYHDILRKKQTEKTTTYSIKRDRKRKL